MMYCWVFPMAEHCWEANWEKYLESMKKVLKLNCLKVPLMVVKN